MEHNKKRILELLSQRFPDIASATSEIINLNAILQLPKGTEHFMSDLHGEYEAFRHILKNASGIIRIKIDEVFGNLLTKKEKTALATLIYYPEERLSYLKKTTGLSDDWYRLTLSRLVELCRGVASKYTRSKVRKALPREFSYIIEELLWEQTHLRDKDEYYKSIVETILRTSRADAFLIALSHLIQRLSVDRLHILGDIFDRGPGPHIILDTLIRYHSVDIAWGNHDILWMGAAAGNLASIASVIRISARYDHLETLESGYGISLRQLISFADTHYKDDPCTAFFPLSNNAPVDGLEADRVARLHKAIAVMQFKAEGALLLRHPEYEMNHRLLLPQINPAAGTITIAGNSYPLCDTHFPTVDWNDPFRLTHEETELLEKLRLSFRHSVRLQEHVRFLFSKGGMYLAENGNLMYHGCIPMEDDGSFAKFLGYSGKSLLEYCDAMARKGYFLEDDHPEKEICRDFYWYLWCGPYSPLFGKRQMATFERYFTKEATLHREEKNPYYRFLEEEDSSWLSEKILTEFRLPTKGSYLINGHVPVRQKKGESPLKAGGRLFVIDGGLAKAYQPKTGIAGYTLISNSHGYLLTAHQPFSSKSDAVEHETDIVSDPVASASFPKRRLVAQTDTGKALKQQIAELEDLVKAYRTGTIKEH